MNKVRHVAVVSAALFLFLGVPALLYVDVHALAAGTVDTVARATMELPDQPSGEFVVLMNTALHEDTARQWEVFFSGGDAGVIMSDIRCMVADADEAGIQLAERFQARLAENQMQIKRENGLLLASKTEHGLFDVVILSREMADAYGLQRVDGDVLRVTVTGE